MTTDQQDLTPLSSQLYKLLPKDSFPAEPRDRGGLWQAVLPAGAFPGIEQFVAVDFVDNLGHTHTTTTVDILMLEGSIQLAIYDPKTQEISTPTLNAGDRIVIYPLVEHKVIGGTTPNRLLITCAPCFTLEDLLPSKVLEERFVK